LIYFFILFISADRFDTADIGKEATMKLHKILGIALVVALSVTAVAAEAKTSRVNYSKNVF
jgi:hypothetical protein